MASTATYYVDRGALIITASGSYGSAASSKDSSGYYASYPFKYSSGKLLTYNSGMLFQGTYKYILIFG